MSSQSLRWNKNNQQSRFIVRKVVEGHVNIDEPDYKKFLRDFPDFGHYNKRTFRRNFKNTIDRWRAFVELNQGKFS